MSLAIITRSLSQTLHVTVRRNLQYSSHSSPVRVCQLSAEFLRIRSSQLRRLLQRYDTCVYTAF